MIDAQELLAKLPEGDEVLLPEVGDIVGWDYAERTYAVRSGTVHALPKPPGQRTYRLSRDEAILVVIACGLALAAGIAICSAIRAIRASGLDPMAFVTSKT
jgi:hypothetical protein